MVNILKYSLFFIIPCTCGIIALYFNYLAQWIGWALILGAFGNISPLFHLYFREQIKKKLKKYHKSSIIDVLFCFIIIFIVLSIFYKIFSFETIITQDHNVHVIQTLLLQEKLFENAHFWGWTNSRFAGMPVNIYYPFGAYLWILAVKLFTFNLLPFTKVYCIAVGLIYALNGIVAYLFGKKVFNRWAGLIAAFIVITDFGNHPTGTWYWMVDIGASPVFLSFSIVFISLFFIENVLNGQEGEKKSIGYFGLFMGLAILCHPLAILLYGVLCFCGFVINGIFNGARQLCHSLKRLSLSCSIGVLIGGLWFIPFILYTEQRHVREIGWQNLKVMAESITDATLIPVMAYVNVLGLIGCAVLLFKKDLLRFLIGFTPFIFILLGSDTFLEASGIEKFFPASKNIHFLRYLLIVKKFWILGAAYLISTSFEYVLSLGNKDAHSVKNINFNNSGKILFQRFAKLFIIGLFVLPILNPGMNKFYKRLTPKVKISLKRHNKFLGYGHQIAATIQNHNKGDHRFVRVAALSTTPNDSQFYDTVRFMSEPYFRAGSEPANFFKYHFRPANRNIMRMINVRYVLDEKKLGTAHYKFIKNIGPIYIHELRKWRKQPFTFLDGKGQATALRYDDENILIDVKDGSEGELMIHTTYFPRWKATFNGKPIKITQTRKRADPQYSFMTVDLKNGPGLYRFKYTLGFPEMLAMLSFAAGSILMVYHLRRFGKSKGAV